MIKYFYIAMLVFGMVSAPFNAHADIKGEQTMANAYQFSFTSITGENMPLSQYKGKAVLVVNTASQCGFTKQYEDLENLYQQYKDRGLVVIGVPCNQFGGQEPGSPEEIQEFVDKTFGVTFPLTAKASVKGDDAHPFFVWAAEQKKGGFLQNAPKWNFHKYLIDTNGDLYKSYGSHIDPDGKTLTKDIEEILGG